MFRCRAIGAKCDASTWPSTKATGFLVPKADRKRAVVSCPAVNKQLLKQHKVSDSRQLN